MLNSTAIMKVHCKLEGIINMPYSPCVPEDTSPISNEDFWAAWVSQVPSSPTYCQHSHPTWSTAQVKLQATGSPPDSSFVLDALAQQ